LWGNWAAHDTSCAVEHQATVSSIACWPRGALPLEGAVDERLYEAQ
jgi:hypothetical protein